MGIQNSIQFAKVQADTPWLDFLTAHFALQRTQVHELHALGALYRNQKRWNPAPDEILPAGEIIRVHLKPRRFPIERMSSHLILQSTEDWIAIWKPAGLPSHQTLDNQIENGKAWLENHLGCNLWSLSRLDMGTRGILVFARTQEFASEFHTALENRKVKKYYDALSSSSGFGSRLWKHLMIKSERAPKTILPFVENSNHQICELEVWEQKEISDGVVFSKINLLTGRTHQIRAQFAFEGAPLLGDQLYGSNESFGENPKGHEQFALSCEKLIFQWRGQSVELCRPEFIQSFEDFSKSN